jgi:hypothetical protein
MPEIKVKVSRKEASENSNSDSVKSIVSLLKEIHDEYIILSELVVDTGFTGIEDNFRLREKLNDIIHYIRKSQDFVIKVKSKNKKSEQ